MRAAVGWFSHLPLPARRSILLKGLIAAAVAFLISMGAVYAIERGIGNSLSCGLWGTCPEGATPGIHLGGGGGGTGAGSTIGGGRVSQNSGIDRDGGVFGSDQHSSPLRQQDPVEQQDRGYQSPDLQQTPSGPNVKPADPNVAPVDPNGEPAPVEPVDPAVPSEPVQPVPGQPTAQQVPSEEGAEVPSQQEGVPSGAEQ